IRMKAGNIYQSYRVGPKELYSTLVNRLLNDAVKKAGEGTPTDKLGSFTDLQKAINQQLEQSLPGENLEHKNTVVTDIVLPEEIASSVRAKIKAAEEIANQRQQTALQEETNKRKLMEAQGETDVRRERANATALAIEKEASELTDLQIKKMWIDKWDGKLPTYVTGEQMQMIMQMKK
ncbi:MAG: SPFH domain-containing protein, partial [Bacteroidota bacterium]